jgi:hypothetical protein
VVLRHHLFFCEKIHFHFWGERKLRGGQEQLVKSEPYELEGLDESNRSQGTEPRRMFFDEMVVYSWI